jgi:MoxR-like ATPase
MSTAPDMLTQFNQRRTDMLNQLRKVVVGQGEVIEQILAAIFTRGHALLIGVPGLAKTLMVSSISQILDVAFKRVQFTPDLMPSDITGTMILDEQEPGRREFRFVRGPIFTNILLADEINRTPPKTQAALLEAMQERQVTAGQETYKLPDPFFVIATQNPIEQEGTYPLPEAQLDRFMFTIRVDYPSFEDEKRIVLMAGRNEPVELTKLLTARGIINAQKYIHSIPLGETVTDYAVRLARATRPGDEQTPEFIRKYVSYGAGPRASLYLAEAGRAFAALDGRGSVAEDDIRKAAIPVLRHRMVTNFQAQAEGKSSDDLIRQLLNTIGPREEEKYSKRKK